tara:strand:+ start:134 stop:613 length:480 start_codon:yes stop_codon:yes gene_type:complete
MSVNTERNWVFSVTGRNIQLYQRRDSAEIANVAGYKVRLPLSNSWDTLMYPDESIDNGLMFEGTAFIEAFVNNDPNALDSGSQPTLTEELTPDEDSHVNLNRLLSLAVVDYVRAMVAEDDGKIDMKEYYIKQFYKKLGDNESNKRVISVAIPSSTYAVR